MSGLGGVADGGRPWQLFDLAVDPWELKNLLLEPAWEAEAAALISPTAYFEHSHAQALEEIGKQ